MEVSEFGILQITFTRALVDDEAAAIIAKSFMFKTFISNSDTDPILKQIHPELLLATKNELRFQLNFDNPIFITDGYLHRPD